MKVGIITFHRALNYGAVLQAYALQQYLKSLGIDNEIIDYRCDYIEEFYKPIKASLVRDTKTYVREVLFLPYNKGKRRKFDMFIKRCIKTSRPICSHEELEKLNDKYDFFITGSDQVWNLRWSGFDKSYFLDFADDNKKASYAASFGFETIPNGEKEKYRELLSGFRYLSVRENTGRQIIGSLLQREAVVSLDPTCLLGKDIWENIAVAPDESGYVLMYTLDKSEELVAFAHRKSRELNAKIILISDALRKSKEYEYKGFLAPEEFVGLFKNAGYVVTNSFHGLMFSVIFEKPFCLQYQLSKGAPNSRLRDFVHDFNLENCVLHKNEVSGLVDYKKVNLLMSDRREMANEYIKNILGK